MDREHGKDYNRTQSQVNRSYGRLSSHSADYLTSVILIVRHLPQRHFANSMSLLTRIHRFIMSKSATGSFEGFANNFSGIFNIDGHQAAITGAFTQGFQEFKVSSAKVTYNGLDDFNGPYNIEIGTPPSFIGLDTIDIKFKSPDGKELHVTGNLTPALAQRQTAVGLGRWTTLS